VKVAYVPLGLAAWIPGSAAVLQPRIPSPHNNSDVRGFKPMLVAEKLLTTSVKREGSRW